MQRPPRDLVMRLKTRVLALSATIAAIGATAALIDGCVNPTCMETATCPDSEDAAPSSDRTIDVSVDAGLETDSTLAGRDAQEAGSDSMADAGIDSTTDGNETPDVAEEDAVGNDAPFDAAADANDAGPTCSGICASTAPSGWFGPGAFYDGPSDAAAPPCTAPYTYNPFTQFSTLQPQPATCQCACGSLDAGCSNPTITVYDDNVCRNECSAAAVPSSCTTVCASSGQSAIVTTPPAALAPSCGAPSSTMTSAPQPTWSRQGEACGLPGGTSFADAGCASGSVCAADPPMGFFLCIWKQGDLVCPATGPYQLLYQYYASTDYLDTRGCSATNCTCTPANAGCQLVGVSGFGSAGCPGTPSMLANLDAGACNGNLPTIVSMTSSVTSSGSCSTGGTASPTGTVSQGTPTWTVCCTQ